MRPDYLRRLFGPTVGLDQQTARDENPGMTRNKLGRRRFLQRAGSGLAGLTLLTKLPTRADAQTASRVRIYPLNHNWLYREPAQPNATAAAFNDAGFKRVTIPHTNKLLPWHGFDDKEYEFVSVYRRHFRLPVEMKDRRVFVDFGGVMTAAKVWINGEQLGEYRGGYTPFSFELTPHLNWRGDNVLAVEVDSTERKDIPPFGGDIDYLTFGGIYRDVALRVVPQTFIENVFAKPFNVLSDRGLDVQCFITHQSGTDTPRKIVAELLDGSRLIQSLEGIVKPEHAVFNITLNNLNSVELWDIDHPKLYDVKVKLYEGETLADE